MKRSCSLKQTLEKDRIKFEDVQQEVKDGVVFFNNNYFVQFNDVLVKCFWKGRVFECSDSFINHAGIWGPRYSFNIGNNLASKSMANKAGIVTVCTVSSN